MDAFLIIAGLLPGFIQSQLIARVKLNDFHLRELLYVTIGSAHT